MTKTSILFVVVLVMICGFPVRAQQQCAPPEIAVRPDPRNIFSDEQEMMLGELTYQNMANELRLVRDPELLAYVNQIGARLIKHLPPTGIKFQFFIMDIPQANAFAVPGGYIFLSRKLIAFVASEDELAGVMGHELGHAVVKHGASDFSQELKRVLNVTAVSDRKDIATKYNLLIERWRTRPGSSNRGHEDEQQLEADRMGVYATIAAGYDPQALGQFYGRLVETKAKSGGWFSDIFGRSTPDEKRLREMAKLSDQLPAQCRDAHQANASEAFLKWQADVVSYRNKNLAEDLTGLIWKKELAPKLRTDIFHFAFSPDGRYFLAQDDSAVTVIQRDPVEVVLQVPAPDADEASFTPDGKFVVIGAEDLRYEKWSIAEKKPVQVRELVVRRNCWEHAFSPDGNFLACFDRGLNLAVVDTQTGKRVFEKKEFYKLTIFEYWQWVSATRHEDGRRRFFNIEFSPDSKFLIIARNNKHRFRFSFDYEVVVASEDTMVALDTATMKPIKTGGDLKKVTRRPFTFIDTGRVLGMASENPEDSGIFSFPDGKRLSKILFGGEEVRRTANSNYVVVKPLKNAKMGVFDLSLKLTVSGSDKADADIWENMLVYESVTGEVLLSETHFDPERKILQATPVKTIEIPVATVGELTAADISDNLQWLTVSTKSRGALWNLASGERKVFVRGFRGALLANDGGGIGDFPKLDNLNHSLVLLNPLTSQATPFRQIPETGARQYGGFVLIRRGLKAPKAKDGEKAGKEAEAGAEETSLGSEVHFELRNIITDKVVWSRDFPKEAPAFFFDSISGRMILYWTLGSEEGKAMLKSNPTLAARAKDLGNKDDDYLMEVVDAFAARTMGTLLLETGQGSFSIQDGFSEGNWLVLRDDDNRVLVYAMKEGELRHRFFGTRARLNPARAQIVVENYPGELTFYDLTTGDNQARLNFNSSTAFVKFTLDGKKFFVLTDRQTAYAFDVDKLATNARAN